MERKFDAELIEITEIDARMKILTVLVSVTKRVWFKSVTTTTERTFTYTGDEWINEDGRVVTSTVIKLRLLEMLIADMEVKKLDRYTSTL